MGIKTVSQPPYSSDLAPCDFWLFPKLRGCRYETIEEMKVIDMLTQGDFHGAFQKLLERYNKCIATGGDCFEEDYSFMCVLSIKVPIRKKSGNLFNDPRMYIYIYVCVCVFWPHFFAYTNFIKYNRPFLSIYFLLDPFVLPCCFYRIREEFIYVLSIVIYIPRTFCPTHHQERIYYKSDVTFVFAYYCYVRASLP